MSSSTNYTVGFTIHEAKSLVTKGGTPVDPLVVVRCCGREYSTAIKRGKAGVVSWDESCIWSDIVLKKQDWNSAFIVFEVQAANAFWRNDVIGSCALQLSVVHARRCHQVKRALPLQIVNEPDTKGFLRVTAYVVGPQDTPPSPNDQDSEDELADQQEDIRQAVLDVLTPEKIPGGGKPYHLYVSVHRVEHLPQAPKGERDPFITCEFAGSKLKSSQARSTCNHSFNECFRIPVVTPVQEDSILLNLWDWNFLASDELLAHGRLSFAELRSRPISIRWFNFYGFIKHEVPNVEALAISEATLPPPNFYMGRLQLSARAERLDRVENLMPAQVVAADPVEESQTYPITILPDIYEATGVPGSEICVEVWCGAVLGRTKWVSGEALPQHESSQDETLLSGLIGGNEKNVPQAVRSFSFDQANGRIDALALAVPEDERQQWNVLVSVYSRGGLFKRETRVAYHSLPLATLPTYVDVHPRTPSWIPLRMMPHISGVNCPAAILVTLEKARVETIARGKRKFVSSQEYELRCYVYGARSLPRLGTHAPNPAVRVSCAGVTRQTVPQPETSNPVFMECLRLNCRLATDPFVNISTVAPITITVLDVRQGSESSRSKSSSNGQRSSRVGQQYFLARATCHYDRIRGKLKHQEVPDQLEPRWIEMKGGKELQSRAGDILVAFELLRKKDAAKIPAAPMRPDLMHCSINIAVAGLRDLVMSKTQAGFLEWLLNQEAQASMRPIKRPLVLASVPVWGDEGMASKSEILIPWNPSLPEDPLDQNKHWKTGVQTSYDFFTSASIDCLLPRDPIYDPKLTISVFDRRIKSKYFVGDLTLDLLSTLPWISDLESAYGGTAAHKDFIESINLKKLGAVLRDIQNQLKDQKKGFINLGIHALKDADEEVIREQSCSTHETEAFQGPVKSQWISPSGVPTILLESYAAIYTQGLPVAPIVHNMFTLNVFIPSRFVLAAHGVMAEKRKKNEFFRPSVEGILEDFLSDITWERKQLSKKVGKKTVPTGTMQIGVSLSHKDVTRSTLPNELAALVEDAKKFRQRFRGANNLPTVVRLRVYITRAIALTPVESLRTINPFLVFTIGNKTEGLRGNAKLENANPEFCWLQECDINLPEQTRLEIAVWSKHQSVSGNDAFIGSTVIDLEDRWFSREWQRLVADQKVPLEYRPLYPRGNDSFKRSCGTLEMWVEMMTPQKALEIPRVVLKEATPVGIEIRAVVWGARALSFKGLKKDSVDAQISATLDCSGYKGSQPVTQMTDVHYYSKNGNAIFNWRVVYSNVRLPISSCVLQLAAYDFRSIGSSVFIGEVNIELRSYIEKVGLTLSSREYDAEFRLVNRKHTKAEDTPGYLQVTIQLIAQQEALTRPVGLGRESPNRDPRLTTPLDGRKWEDFLRASGFRKDFSNMIYKFRIALTVFLFFGLFVMGFIYPGLFFQ